MTPNPLAPRTPRQVRRQARYAVGATFNPLFAQLNRREMGNQAAIRDYTRSLSSMLAPIAGQIQGYYNNATAQQQGVDTALANRLNSVGGQEASALQSRLASAGLGTDQAQRVSAVGSGAANTSAALGSANLSQLLASGAAQTAYAGKLPGIAALGGLQFAKQNLAQMEQQRSDLQAKVPGAIQSELGQLQNLEFQKAAANLGFQGTQAKVAAQVASTTARDTTTRRGQDLTYAARQQEIKARRQQQIAAAAAKQSKAQQSAVSKAASQAKSILDAATKPVAVNASGGAVSANPFAPTGSGSQKARQANYYGTLKRVIGVITPILSPYMTRAQITQQAQALANAYYQPGQYGRPGRGPQTIPGTKNRGPGGTGPR